MTNLKHVFLALSLAAAIGIGGCSLFGSNGSSHVTFTREVEPAPVGDPTFEVKYMSDIHSVAHKLQKHHRNRQICIGRFYPATGYRYERGVFRRAVEGNGLLVIETKGKMKQVVLSGGEEIWVE